MPPPPPYCFFLCYYHYKYTLTDTIHTQKKHSPTPCPTPTPHTHIHTQAHTPPHICPQVLRLGKSTHACAHAHRLTWTHTSTCTHTHTHTHRCGPYIYIYVTQLTVLFHTHHNWYKWWVGPEPSVTAGVSLGITQYTATPTGVPADVIKVMCWAKLQQEGSGKVCRLVTTLLWGGSYQSQLIYYLGSGFGLVMEGLGI